MDKVSSRHVNWIDVENPGDSEIAELSRRHTIHPLVAQELKIATYRPKLENYGDHLYLILHFPIFDPKSHTTISREIDFLIYPYNLITVHYEDVPQLDDFHELLAAHEAVRERKFGSSSGHLLYHIISQLFSISLKELNALEEKIKKIEENVFNGGGKHVLRDIARMRRDLLNFQTALKPQHAVLDSLIEHAKQFFGPDIMPYFHDIKGEYIQVRNSVQDLRETLDVLYETYISLLSVSTNEVMKTLTLIASILLPITVIASVFGMNVPHIPLQKNPDAFWYLVGSMGLVTLVIYRVFKSRKWL